MNVTPIYLTFLNPYGGFDYFLFTSEKEHQLNITEVGTTRENTFPNWPNSWGSNADTINKKTFTTANKKIIVRSQHLTVNQRDALMYIKTSPVVQIVVTRTDRRTVIVDDQSYKIYDEGDKLYTITFTIELTNNVESQTL